MKSPGVICKAILCHSVWTKAELLLHKSPTDSFTGGLYLALIRYYPDAPIVLSAATQRNPFLAHDGESCCTDIKNPLRPSSDQRAFQLKLITIPLLSI